MSPTRPQGGKILSRYLGLGLEMGISLGFGILIGRYLDKRFDTAPVLFLCGLAIGFGAAVKAFVVAVRRAMKETAEDESSQP